MFVRWPCWLVSAVAVAGCAGGCLNPRDTRLPSLYTGDPRIADPDQRNQAERRDLERHDPFPSNTAGPPTFTRPRGHVEERTDIRRAREEAALHGMNRDGNGPQRPPSSQRDPYPDAVRE